MAFSWEKQSRRPLLDELEFRQVERVVGIKKILPLAATILLFVLLMLFCLICIRPWNELKNLEQERAFAQARLLKSQEKRDQAKNHYVWMVEDSAYFELIARDKNGLAKPEEVIILPENLPRASSTPRKP